jgi:hypothetical protein
MIRSRSLERWQKRGRGRAAGQENCVVGYAEW